MIGSILKEARGRRQLSIRQLAAKTGISHATLSRWEAGKARPNAPELEQVFQALGVPDALQRQCFQLLGTPQAVRHLIENHTQAERLPVSGGELLRALRQRQGKSQADVARAIGVTQALLSRWENNDCWPDETRLLALCHALQATPSETQGLLRRDWQTHSELPRDRDALVAALRELALSPHHFEHDLFYLALGSRFWTLYRENQIERTDALMPWGFYGSYLAWHGRMDEALRIASPTFENLKYTSHPLDAGQLFALSATTLAMATLGAPKRAQETFLAFEQRISLQFQSSLYEDLADIAWKAKQHESCDRYWLKSIETAYSDFNQAYCRLRFAEKLCLAGRPREALAQVEQSRIDRTNAHSLAQIDLVAGGALGLLKENQESERLLERGRDQLRKTPYPGLNAFSQQLEQLLAT